MKALRPTKGLCQDCQQIKVLAIDSRRIENGKVINRRLCWDCLKKQEGKPS